MALGILDEFRRRSTAKVNINAALLFGQLDMKMCEELATNKLHNTNIKQD